MQKNDETLPFPVDKIYLGTIRTNGRLFQFLFPSLEAGRVVVYQRNEQLLVVRGYDEIMESRIPLGIDGLDEINIEEI